MLKGASFNLRGIIVWNYLWPMLLIVVSNIFYNITTKETPEKVNPFFSLVVTYLVGALVAFIIYLATSGTSNISNDFKSLNWTSFILGTCIVGLEAGYIYLYRFGWQISIGSLVANITLAMVLLLVGVFLYRDVIGIKQIIGVVFCVAGLAFINSK